MQPSWCHQLLGGEGFELAEGEHLAEGAGGVLRAGGGGEPLAERVDWAHRRARVGKGRAHRREAWANRYLYCR